MRCGYYRLLYYIERPRGAIIARIADSVRAGRNKVSTARGPSPTVSLFKYTCLMLPVVHYIISQGGNPIDFRDAKPRPGNGAPFCARVIHFCTNEQRRYRR